MTTCHQCNSEIADADVFCPYCGISLAPVDISSEEDEFASTIMMTPEIASSVEEKTVTSEPRVQEPEPEQEIESPVAEVEYDDITPPMPDLIREAEPIVEYSEPTIEEPLEQYEPEPVNVQSVFASEPLESTPQDDSGIDEPRPYSAPEVHEEPQTDLVSSSFDE